MVKLKQNLCAVLNVSIIWSFIEKGTTLYKPHSTIA